jgi:hypothetical protein
VRYGPGDGIDRLRCLPLLLDLHQVQFCAIGILEVGGKNLAVVNDGRAELDALFLELGPCD